MAGSGSSHCFSDVLSLPLGMPSQQNLWGNELSSIADYQIWIGTGSYCLKVSQVSLMCSQNEERPSHPSIEPLFCPESSQSLGPLALFSPQKAQCQLSTRDGGYVLLHRAPVTEDIPLCPDSVHSVWVFSVLFKTTWSSLKIKCLLI
jgi:hypothetical protein